MSLSPALGPGTRAMPTLQQPTPGGGAASWGQSRVGGELWTIFPVRFLVELQRRMQRSHAVAGKAQGMELLRSPPPAAHPSPAPGPSRAFPARSRFPVVFWACLFAAFADSAQPCCPPDSSRSSGHGTARLHSARSPEPCQVLLSPAGSPEPRQAPLSPAGSAQPAAHPGVAELPPALPDTAALAQPGRGSHGAHACARMDGMSGLLCSQNVPRDHREVWAIKGQLWDPRGDCSQLSQTPSVPAALPAPARRPRGLSPAARGAPRNQSRSLPVPPAWIRRSGTARAEPSSPARSSA